MPVYAFEKPGLFLTLTVTLPFYMPVIANVFHMTLDGQSGYR